MDKAGSLLLPLFGRLGITEDVCLQRIRNDWHTLFEKPLSSHMSPSRLFEGDLLLCVDSPAWMQQLAFCKGEILKKLANYGVRDLKFRVGKVVTPGSREGTSAKARKRELSAEEAYFISDTVSRIGDDTLKETIRKTIEKSLLSGKSPK